MAGERGKGKPTARRPEAENGRADKQAFNAASVNFTTMATTLAVILDRKEDIIAFQEHATKAGKAGVIEQCQQKKDGGWTWAQSTRRRKQPAPG